MDFEFATASRIIFGQGSINKVAPIAADLGRRVLVVTGRTVDRAEPLLAQLTHKGLECQTFGVVSEPTTEIALDGVDRARANNMLTDALKSLFAVAENYPNLKANENFKMLQEELAGTENKIAYIRTAYNDAVVAFNRTIEVFPNNLIAGMLGFKRKPYFEAAETERKAVKVKF